MLDQRLDNCSLDPAIDTEQLLADVLADVLGVERVSVTADFFEDLGTDSLLMAHFCARLGKRGDLPSISIKDVYQNPTISDLAASVGGPAPAIASARPVPLPPTDGQLPVARWQYVLCGALQLLALLEFTALGAIIAARGFDWVSAADGVTGTYLRSMVFSGSVFVAWAALGIAAKWAIVGRWTPEQIPIWSVRYMAFWFAKIVIQSNPLVAFVGTPIYVLYLRALGARIGRNVVILSRSVPVCADLLTIGDNAVIRKDSALSCYRANAGFIQTGRVTIGADAFVGEATVLDIDTSIGDGAQIGHASALIAGQSIPDGEHRVGSPADHTTEVDYLAVAPTGRASSRRVTYSIAQLLFLFTVSLPLVSTIGIALAESRIAPTGLLNPQDQPFASWAFLRDVLIFSLALFLIVTPIRLLVVLIVPRILNLAIKPDVTYPLFGIRYWAHRTITRVSNVTFFTNLFGDSSYIVHYLFLLGYKVSFDEQTGANFGLNVKHDNPYNVSVGPGTMAADGLSIINADYSNTSFRVSPVTIGGHSFIGNSVGYPAQSATGEDCLLGSKVMVPVDGEEREKVGFLGSPSFEIPRMVLRDRKFDHLKQGEGFNRRLRAKNRHNVASMMWFLLSRWVALFGAALFALAAADLYIRFGAIAILVGLLLSAVARPLYSMLVERASIGFKPLRPLYCSIYDRESWRIERYWKLSWQPAILNGTPFKSFIWRLMGVRVGKRLFDDGAILVEKTMITVGDDCAFNAASVIQPHSQEDGSFKSDNVVLGDGCTLGVAALVHYGVTMGDRSTLAANAFLMKGTEVPPGSNWGDNPARELNDGRQAEIVSTTATPANQTAPTTTTISNTAIATNTNQKTTNPNTINEEAETMRASPVTDHDYWRSVLLAGGSTSIPRWTPDPGIDQHDIPVAEDIIAALHRLAEELDVSFSSILLAAHAKVLAALSGEREVATGYVAPSNGRALPCRTATDAHSWQELLLACHRAESDLIARQDIPVDDIRSELRLTEPAFETTFDPGDDSSHMAEGTVMGMSFLQQDGQDIVRLRYRNDAIDKAAAARIAGYHVAALSLIAADPGAEHGRQSLLSAEELDFQLDDLAGPRRELPDQRFHELFEQQVKANPDAIAAVHGHRPWTYRELNARANQLGRALLARGLEAEAAVAVVTERNLNWLAAVLAIFKAGGVYLPIEPHFPADRIATTLSRADCKLVMTEQGSTATLDQALDSLPAVQPLLIDAAYDERHAGHDLGIDVAPDQLAYIYFTSGSTGEPKGAMCEHAGMLNHLYAKIDDLEIGEGETVAQIAPQCFDISLWQLVSALLVGGRTVLVEQDTILDPERFADTIVDHRVAVMQVVPSYLEVLLSYLEQNPRSLPELHCVSVTGEALTLELTQRWFTTKPAIKLANAYGLTETSDDTNHEVMDRAPARGGVPLGPAINNVEVRVVDEYLSPVPLGAPGEIVFTGICVGRGYINDPDRTKLAYLPDPVRDGQRLYRSGDYGRWRPDGKLEFLGRRDAQVKIRGFRIEIGEIENALQGAPGVREGAVVVTERSDGSKQLVGFYSGQRHGVDSLQDRLGRTLPEYMVPPALHWWERLPLTDNGKIDRKALAALAGELETTDRKVDAPTSDAERRLADVWAAVLGVAPEQIGRNDDFFDRGGTSLSAVEVVIALGSVVTLKDITKHPILAELALLIDEESAPQSELLQLLSEPNDSPGRTLVCFPYAGGNAINFQAMARALRDSDLAVYAVELPGHNLGTDQEPFAPLDAVVAQVVSEILTLGPSPIILWGHSSGVAGAIEAARKLEHQGTDVQRVVLAAQLLGTGDDRRDHIALLGQRTDTEIAAELLQGDDYTELGSLEPEHAARVGAAYRHDCVAAHEYLLGALDTPPTNSLHAPVTVVIAADDPSTAGWSDHFADWQLVAENVSVHELADGGHYFLRNRPNEAAEIVRNIADNAPNSAPPRTSSSTATLDVDVRPGALPMLRVDTGDDPASWAFEHRDNLRAVVTEHGSVRLRGLGLGDAVEIGAVARALASGPVVEREAFAARQTYDTGVYSSSEWPPNQQMCMHHELSYRLEVPGLMLFGCVVEPDEGGAIALADSPTVHDALPTDLVERFTREGWMLTRSYTDEIGLSVAEAFGTEDRSAVESYCLSNDIEFEWQPDGGLRTKQRRPAVVRHPITGQQCWFNQIAFLSEWTMNPEVHEFLVDTYGADGLPFNTRYGNGDPISHDVVAAINEAYDTVTTSEPLQGGDLLLVDNIRTAHSREPFSGEREVIVAMAESVKMADLRSAVETGVD